MAADHDLIGVGDPEYDLWEFITCSKCHLSYSENGGAAPAIPFWLTECGHVLCNSHLNANQSCSFCNAQKIEITALQRDMPPPMSDWFGYLPHKLDAAAQIVKLQQELLMSLLRHLRKKYSQQRNAIERLMGEMSQLKGKVNLLEEENHQLRQSQDYRINMVQEPAHMLNGNGKRPMTDYRMNTSSPRSTTSGMGPSRLTLPPEHAQPRLRPLNDNTNVANDHNRHQVPSSIDRPGSRQFNRRYAYIPPPTPQLAQQQTSRHQDGHAPLQHVSTQPHRQVSTRQAPVVQQTTQRVMPPPPTPVYARHDQIVQSERPRKQGRIAQTPRAEMGHQSQQQQQVPPGGKVFSFRHPMPQPGQMQARPEKPGHNLPSNSIKEQSSQRFVSTGTVLPGTSSGQPSHRFVAQTPSDRQRFVPPTPNLTQRGPPQTGSGHAGYQTSGGIMTSAGANVTQRMPFTFGGAQR